MFLVTANQMQEMDRETIESFGIPGLVLMENAGRGAFDMLIRKFKDNKINKVAVFAGRGNNGGDGFVIARYLMEKGIIVTIFLLSSKEKVAGDAKINMALAQKLCDRSQTCFIIEIPDGDAFQEQKASILLHDLFIDAIFGTGLNSDVRGFFKDAIELINSSTRPVFSVDIPSGLHSDTGQPLGIAVKADATATFAFAKAGHILYPGNRYAGDLEVIDIGIPDFIAQEKAINLFLIEKKKIAACFGTRKFQSHKGSYGHLLVIAGSTGKTGAASLCTNAAMRCGTGLVTLGIAKSLNQSIEPQVIEPMTHPLPETGKGFLSDNCFEEIMGLLKNRQALALGPGIGTREATKKLVLSLIEKSNVPIVIDADAINCISQNTNVLKKKKAPAILTPHPGEMARLCNLSTRDIQENRLKIASQFAKDHDVILVLKGAQTIICLTDGRSYICPTGNPGMASGGMGDVLTGMIAGFCAQGFSPENASLAGVYIHGMCADRLADDVGGFGFVARDMIPMIPKTIHRYLL
ncbi:MAG: NAD(P)H-hydrate dehydratase [Desulfobacula sp.]|jgi:NAD(P)H-hydrate epimerase|uniref:NAD(P)H-hydrate dehydratase n=1 Tax=Desulfobacula sp. TaxID=2593537 RepID=UPI001D775E98|nr:NAD(P)H-hydrate dehydratase [Desulfobacula sp.]MBT3484861.1 NAD(P)H-hydrate dehydratase [Desulfobacula sp.]MBT3804669.1 NAD(P)H-hydrate dehydratase [Desulfobacula sp.]MBT4024019.1 NAD(P)H-hydrate dehydratase [Desulfobacula sp.]MBT4198381.1 NAD(P)H-hydrate dehydratase [Desulfobacula sp.]